MPVFNRDLADDKKKAVSFTRRHKTAIATTILVGVAAVAYRAGKQTGLQIAKGEVTETVLKQLLNK